jgi:rhamnosyltransferase subunit B
MAAPARARDVLLLSFGSLGDVHPMLALGQALQARGHRTTMLTNPAFAATVAQAGLAFVPVGAAEDYRATIAHPKLWHPVDGFGVMWRYLLRPALGASYERIAELRNANTVLVANPMAMGARVAQERLGLPLVTAYTATTMLRTLHDPMTLARWRVPRWMPRAARRTLWHLIDRWKLEPLVRPSLDALRRSLGLPPIASPVFGRWMHSPQAGVALFPAWFAPAAPDWPPQVEQAGFPLYDGDAAGQPSAHLAAFVEAGPPPVVFMPGTAATDVNGIAQGAIEACRRTGQRGVLLVPKGRAPALPAQFCVAPYAPFSWLLPRARALVHHAGVGSTAQALRAGVPQLLLPQAYDQFDNAICLERLGVGRRAAGPASLPDALAALLSDAKVRDACARWAPMTTPDAARAAAVAAVERVA